MTCSICSAPAVSADLCATCASRVEVVKPASLTDLRAAARRRYWLDRAGEGDERARQRCIRKGWLSEESAMDAEQYAERRMETFVGARMAGATVEAAWEEVDALR